MKSVALITILLPLTLLAQPDPPTAGEFESPAVLNATAILKPEFATGAGFTVRGVVPTYGGRNGYMIDSDYGVLEADGNAMLVRRVREIAAIARLRETSRTDEYKKALSTAATSPLLVAKGLVEHPTSTITGVPKGLWKFMNRAGQSVKERAERRPRSEYEDSNAAQFIGFSKAKRDVALKLGVDPYSSNQALQRELNGISWAAFAGKMTFTIATAPVGGEAGLALTAAGVTGTFEQALRDQSPSDLRLRNLKALLSMECDRALADAFLANDAFSPSTQTALVLHLEALRDVGNRAAFVQLATDQTSSEGDALFFVETSRILAQLHTGGRTLARIETLDDLPVGITADGGAVLALEWDYASWTQNAAEFIVRLKAAKFGKKAPSGIVVALSGDASPLVQQRLNDAGIQLATRLAPGPLN